MLRATADSTARRSRIASASVVGIGRASPRGCDPRCSSASASWSAKKGFPPEIWYRACQVGCEKLTGRCNRTTSSSSSSSSASSRSRMSSLLGKVWSSSSGLDPASRTDRRNPTRSSVSRCTTNRNTSAEGASSHCTSSIARTVGVSAADARMTASAPRATATRSREPSSDDRRNANSSARRCGSGRASSTASSTPSRRSPRPRNDRALSDSEARQTSTR